jgi:hypothetical protein
MVANAPDCRRPANSVTPPSNSAFRLPGHSRLATKARVLANELGGMRCSTRTTRVGRCGRHRTELFSIPCITIPPGPTRRRDVFVFLPVMKPTGNPRPARFASAVHSITRYIFRNLYCGLQFLQANGAGAHFGRLAVQRVAAFSGFYSTSYEMRTAPAAASYMRAHAHVHGYASREPAEAA